MKFISKPNFSSYLQFVSKLSFSLAVLVSFLSYSYSSYAMSALDMSGALVSVETEKTNMPVSFTLSTGVLNGDSHEYVYYQTGEKLSELTWKLDNVIMVGGQISAEITKQISLNAGTWVKASAPSTTMTDYDWTDIKNPDQRTHWSETETELEKGLMADININGVLLSSDLYSFSAIAGFHYDNWKWNSMDGVFSYPNGSGKFSDVVPGMDSNDSSVIYEQKFYAPYLGFGFNLSSSKWLFNSRIIATPFAKAEGIDEHVLTNYLYKDTFEEIFYFSAGASLAYLFTDYFSMNLSFDYQKYDSTKGDTKLTNLSTGATSKISDVAGISHESYMVSLGASYRF
ncbi:MULTISPECIES: omptin family outer membrane protease [Psychrilyobacter]|uniref:Omptin family outer membrane protease n=1 Tax=Psychrilyobacter piezotolerans TaxID=2293438 RepID=A0ABX9KIR7_9FUSO|nr:MULTISPECIES: omptin family outer membrane protease [Psychrilyobacter]MCS5423241.1 omptin family outer membrane protease [Psychrilyobacter sp. S5]NDI77477.1 omptin family outer membrane protease [Psychrilyobacter piezotolerans]RDE63775.1 omptin family outer membrane protease [Psychrilyobacter sp. S5]REI42119.1 omptin family outer membrane protease [Psychrilyobacter piezotolerans]